MEHILLALLFSLFFVEGLYQRLAPFLSMTVPRQRRRLMVLYSLVLVVNSLVMYLLFETVGVSLALTKADYFLVPILTTVINCLVIPGRLREHLFIFGIHSCYNFMLSAVPTCFISRTMGMGGADSILALLVSQMGLMLLFFLPIRRLIQKTVEPFLCVGDQDYWNTTWFIPIAMLLAVIVMFPGNVHVSSFNQLLSRGFTGIATILMCYNIARDHRTVQEKQEMAERLMDQKIHYSQLQTRMEDTRKLRHDFKHHIAAIRHFIDTDNKEGLREYCDTLSTRVLEEIQVPYTGNPAADGVVYRYMQLSRQRNIRFEYNGTITSTGIADVDLCVLLGNALDNALAGCGTIPDNRRIRLAARTEGQVLSLMIKNTFNGEVRKQGETILSSKRDNLPGYGLASMEDVCRRYGGQMRTEWDENTFTTLILLPVET